MNRTAVGGGVYRLAAIRAITCLLQVEALFMLFTASYCSVAFLFIHRGVVGL